MVLRRSWGKNPVRDARVGRTENRFDERLGVPRCPRPAPRKRRRRREAAGHVVPIAEPNGEPPDERAPVDRRCPSGRLRCEQLPEPCIGCCTRNIGREVAPRDGGNRDGVTEKVFELPAAVAPLLAHAVARQRAESWRVRRGVATDDVATAIQLADLRLGQEAALTDEIGRYEAVSP